MQASAKELLKFAPGGVFHWVMEALQKDPEAEFQLSCSHRLPPLTGKFDKFQWNCDTPSDYSLKEKTKWVWAVAYFKKCGTRSGILRYNDKSNAIETADHLMRDKWIVLTPTLVEIPLHWITND